MAKEAIVQIRMDSELKESAEKLYKDLGTSFAEAVRIFARQSVTEQAMPFMVTMKKQSAYGILSGYSDFSLMKYEESAFQNSMVEKHEKSD